MGTGSVKMRQMVEKRIVRALIRDALAAGYSLNVHNGGDTNELPAPSTSAKEVLAVMFATDDEHLLYHRDGKRVGWVWLVYGNDGGEYVINDYTCNLEHVMQGADAVSARYQ